MNKIKYIHFILLTFFVFQSCNKPKEKDMNIYEKGTFGYDLKFLSDKDSLIILNSDDEQAQVIVSPKYQAKVFTSTATGLSGNSLGFINYKALNSDVVDDHMNGYGGENRFWLGPEGGKYSVYFSEGKEQVFDNWHTPKPIDIEAWNLVGADKKQVTLSKEMEVTNYLGYTLMLNVDRKIELLDAPNVFKLLGLNKNQNVNTVAYTTKNTITNLNDFEWTKETGTICIWMLDMFIPAPQAVTFIPFNEGNEQEMGNIATTDYFGEIPADRLKIKDSILYLKTDGNYRSKLGMNGKRTKAIAANYDPSIKRLTIVTYDVDKDAIYLNQEWNPNKDPLIGDAMNAYNDGPLEDGSIMGPFLEIESVSPAAFLKPSQSLSHQHTVFHFIGDDDELSKITEQLFNVSINQIKTTF